MCRKTQSEMPTNIKVICSHAHQWHVDLHQDRSVDQKREREREGVTAAGSWGLPSMEANQQFSHLFFVSEKKSISEWKKMFAVGVCRTECSVGRAGFQPPSAAAFAFVLSRNKIIFFF